MTRTCETCGRVFEQLMGRPARFCPEHRHHKDPARYGSNHQRLRAMGPEWGSPCVRCGGELVEGQEVHLDHLDGGGPEDYAGWSHGRCNVVAGARKGGRMRALVGGGQGRRGVDRESELEVRAGIIAADREVVYPDIFHAADCRCGGAVSRNQQLAARVLVTSQCW